MYGNKENVYYVFASISTVHHLYLILFTYKCFKDSSGLNKLSVISFILFFDKSLMEKIRYSKTKSKSRVKKYCVIFLDLTENCMHILKKMVC